MRLTFLPWGACCFMASLFLLAGISRIYMYLLYTPAQVSASTGHNQILSVTLVKEARLQRLQLLLSEGEWASKIIAWVRHYEKPLAIAEKTKYVIPRSGSH
ncbi:hypothetical protein J3F84DRAFT_374709 [Trichoderma pleuroticola]